MNLISLLRDNVATPVIAGLALGIAFVVLFSFVLASPVEVESNGFVVTRLSEEWKPWLAPPNGVPHLLIAETAIDPGRSNKVSYGDALWLHRAMDDKGKLAKTDESVDIGQQIGSNNVVIRLDDAEKEAYFDFYKRPTTNTGSFEVIFSNGSVRYYQIYFLEAHYR